MSLSSSSNQADFFAAGSKVCATVEDTWELAAQFGAVLQAGDLVILDGPLGAGKTTFTQGLARGLGVAGRVKSPTFTIARPHKSLGDGPDLIHVDAYRLLGEDPAAAADPLGALDSLDFDYENAVVVAEWGKGLFDIPAARRWLISFDRQTLNAADPESEARIISWAYYPAT